jgi:hypothetical protein
VRDWGVFMFGTVPIATFLDSPSIRPRPLPSTSFPSRHSSLILPFDATAYMSTA